MNYHRDQHQQKKQVELENDTYKVDRRNGGPEYALGKDGEQQIGFARIVTDYSTFAWLCDVFIAESHRGQGLGKWLVKSVTSHPEVKSLKYILLATSDAHELYRKYGDFKALQAIDKWMVRYLEIKS